MHNRIIFIVIVVAAALFFTGLHAPAASVKERMLARIPAINTLKDKGIIGENNKGYLEYRSADRPEQQLVNGENNDRKSVYQAIAKQQGTTAELVGKRRALQIAEKAEPGEWLQDSSGKWYKK